MESNIIENNLGKINSKESIAKRKIKEYFENNKVLTHEKFNEFLEFIGIKEIWSTEKEQNLLWDSIAEKSTDKKNIDYDSTLNVISKFFEEDDDKDIADMYDENLYNINLKDISIEEADNINLFNIKKNMEQNEKYIDEFINNINNNQDTLYDIRFINEIFFNKYFNNKNYNISEIIMKQSKIIINYDEIIEKIKKDYKFLNISTEVLKSYLNYISDNDIDDNIIIEKDNENKNFCLNKDLINYVNAIVDLKIEENNKNHNINLNNSSLSSGNSSNINGNSIEFSIEKLSVLDAKIINCLDGIISQNLNIDFIKLVKKYIENYILYIRQSIYNDIKSKELEFEHKINQSNNTCNKCNKDIEKENKKLLNDEKKSFLRKHSKLHSKQNELSENKVININEIMKKNKNLSSLNLRNSLSMPKEQKRKYTQLKKVPSKIKLSKASTDNLYLLKCETQNNKSITKPKQQNKINALNGNKSRTFSSIDYIDDITASRIDSFSNNGNANGSLFLLETTKLCDENLEDDDRTSNKNMNKINAKNNQKLMKRKINTSVNKKTNYNIIDINSDINNESCIKMNNEENYDDYEDIEDNFLTKGKIHSSNNFFLKKNMSTTNDYNFNGNYSIRNSDVNAFNSISKIDNCYNTFAYGPLNGQSYIDINKKDNQENIFSIRAINYFYDFKYLAYSHRVQRLFSMNNEKVNANEFFSEQINAYFSKTNKQNCAFIMSFNSFYFLKVESLECILRLNINSLESITISPNNYNLLLLSFKNGADIIIESFQRMELLIFLQNAISKRKLEKDIKIISSNKFILRKKDDKKEIILTFKNKMFNLTPNFENAQKVGILLKYQENIFSASFHKKLVALCPLGLIYFNDNCKTPKAIIPIIGTTIKAIIVQTNEKIYCLKFITINDEIYIFGSLKKREIFDWKKEILHFRKMYDNRMRQINPNYGRKSSKFDNKDIDDELSKKTNKTNK